MRIRLKRGDLVVIAAVLLLTAVLFLSALASGGGDASVLAVVTEEGCTYFPLSEARSVEVAGYNGIVLNIEIDGKGGARVASSGCRDKLCMRAGYLSKSGDCAVCLPARVSVRIEGKHGGKFDAVT